MQNLPGAGGLAPQQIQFKIEDAQAGCLAAGRAVAPEQIAQPGQQFRQREGLGQVIVAALLQAAHAVINAAPRRQDQHRRADPQLTQLENQADPVHVRQSKVNNQDVERSVNRQPLGGFAIRCRLHLVASLLQRSAQEALNIDFVLNEQKPHEGILFHSGEIFIDKFRSKTGNSRKTAVIGRDEHIVMAALVFCHAYSVVYEIRRQSIPQ